MLYDDPLREPLGAIDDDRLRLVFTCCHPALAMESRVALTLRMVGGLTVPEIARAFLVQESHGPADHPREGQDQGDPHPLPGAVGRGPPGAGLRRPRRALPRLQRGLPGERPRHRPGASRPDRRGDPADPDGACADARRRRGGRAAGADAPHRGTSCARVSAERRAGHARRAGPRRVGRRADRARVIGSCASGSPRGSAPGRYQILAAINAVHTSARDVRDTDWSQIVALYDQLVRLDPSPIVALNRAVAVAELDGPDVALATVDRLGDTLVGLPRLPRDARRPAAPAGPQRESRAAYDEAIAARRQHRRDGVPDPATRPAGAAVSAQGRGFHPDVATLALAR